jgi:hypothetical protein
MIFFWAAGAIIVGVAANTRGRSGGGWFLLACVISPLLAGLLVLALPRRDVMIASQSANTKKLPVPDAFEPESVYAGLPYRVIEGGAIDALMSGTRVRFKTIDQFKAAAEGRNALA